MAKKGKHGTKTVILVFVVGVGIGYVFKSHIRKLIPS